MKTFACVVLLVAAAAAAPEGKRDKRGFLHGGYELGHASLGYDSFGHGALDLGHHGHIESVYAAPAARIVSVNKLVEVPRVVEVKKIVSVPKVVSVPHIVKVSRIVEEPHFGHGISSGWW
ncbi:CBL-interacting protein kinase 6-like [Vanessa cardui]|uniref:CBL-interacting protein kinase 6-like n=1 Tax=Vanessa cardui TaxID=171605 RepID=UPI001F143B80|nr:CBL-interacting protein kinase 6-like [Vanessa cardui]